MMAQILIIQRQINLQISKMQLKGRERTFGGVNFDGQIKMDKDDNTMRLDITQFKKGMFYSAELNSVAIEKDSNHYLFFRKALQIFDLLVENKDSEINDVGCLIVPLQVLYKGKKYRQNVKIILKAVKFSNEEQEKDKLYKQIARIYKQKQNLGGEIQKFINCPSLPINMKGDMANPDYKSFQILKNGKQIKMVEKDIFKTFNHYLTLPDTGSYYLKLKIVKTKAQKIFIGICGEKIKGENKIYEQLQFIGLYLNNGTIWANSKSKKGAEVIEVVEDKSIFKFQIDMSQKKLKWFLDQKLLCQQNINQNLSHQKIYPLICLFHQGDIIEFID